MMKENSDNGKLISVQNIRRQVNIWNHLGIVHKVCICLPFWPFRQIKFTISMYTQKCNGIHCQTDGHNRILLTLWRSLGWYLLRVDNNALPFIKLICVFYKYHHIDSGRSVAQNTKPSTVRITSSTYASLIDRKNVPNILNSHFNAEWLGFFFSGCAVFVT